MDLMCYPAATVGLLISIYYVGFAVGGLFCTFPDKFGRKKSVMFGLAVSLISQTLMLLSSSFWMRLAMFFVAGLSQIKNTCSYVWLSESTSKPYKSITFTYINSFDALPFVFTCLFYMFVSKNWIILPAIFCGLSYVAFILAFFCPESPRWLLVNGRSKEAIVELNKFAKINGAVTTIPSIAVFVEDPTNILALMEGNPLEDIMEEEDYHNASYEKSLKANFDQVNDENKETKAPLLGQDDG